MRPTKSKVNAEIARIVEKHLSKLFDDLSNVGGNNFRRTMRRVRRVIRAHWKTG
jgi:hypothetical protein